VFIVVGENAFQMMFSQMLVAMNIEILLKLNRADLAEKKLKEMQKDGYIVSTLIASFRKNARNSQL